MKPGESGSLQSHADFDELWTLLDDGAVVQVGDDILRPRAYDEIYIPRGTKHRLSNEHGTHPIRMFEVAYGQVHDWPNSRLIPWQSRFLFGVSAS